MAQGEKTAADNPATTEETPEVPKKSRKLLYIVIAVIVLLLAGGATAFFLPKGEPPKRAESAIDNQPKPMAKFVDLGTFTSNLVREDEERFLHVTISIKLTKPELEEKIKASSPEILHRINMVLQSKRASELMDFAGKEKLAKQIQAQVEYVLDLRKVSPPISAEASGNETVTIKNGISEILFTSFLIQ